VAIVRRREIAAGAERDRLADEYAGEHLHASVAARQGFIDEVIAPRETRARLAWGLDALGGGSP
jgi:propionyl-CoA carboxylase beta chain